MIAQLCPLPKYVKTSTSLEQYHGVDVQGRSDPVALSESWDTAYKHPNKPKEENENKKDGRGQRLGLI